MSQLGSSPDRAPGGAFRRLSRRRHTPQILLGSLFSVCLTVMVWRILDAGLLLEDGSGLSKLRKRSHGDSSLAQDIYGIGVRVGFYLQAAGVVFTCLRPLRAPSAANSPLFSAVISVAILSTWSRLAIKRSISPAESIVVLNTVSANLFSAGFSVLTSSFRANSLGVFVYIATQEWLFSAYMWFWARGYRKLPILDTNNVTWVFAKVRIDGWYHTFGIVMTSFILFGLFTAGISLMVVIVKASGWWWSSEGNDDEWTIRVEDDDDERMSLTGLRLVLQFSTIWSLISLPFFVAATEMTIVWNGLSPYKDIVAPGQLIPFVTGLASLTDGLLYLFRPSKGDSEDVVML